jgi:hypothetical protein
VIAFLGRPDADRRGSENGSRRFRALGYACTRTSFRTAWPILPSGPFCRTVYWFSDRTGKLGDFYTTSPRYVTSRGVRIGMGTAAAERRLHQVLYAGCEENLEDGSLTIAFQGGTMRREKTAGSSGLRVFGAHVYALAVSDGRSDVGIFDCL